MNRGGHVQFVLPGEEIIEIECTPHAGIKASVCYHHGVACVDRLCSWESSTGHRGFCDVRSKPVVILKVSLSDFICAAVRVDCKYTIW